MSNQLQTTRLRIRPTSIEDAPFIYELMNTPKWIQFIGDRKIRTEDDAKAYIETKMLPQLKKLGHSNNTIIRTKDGVKIGTCGLYAREEMEGLDIGFAFLPDYEGMGYAFEASDAIIQQAIKNLKLTIINAYTAKNNFASQKLLRKLGLDCIGTVVFPNETEEIFFFQLKVN